MAARRGRPSAPTSIVPVRLAATSLQDVHISHRELSNITSTDLDSIRWLAEHCLIANSFLCDTCNEPMSFQRRQGNIFVDGWAWSCKRCRRQRSIRTGSFFEGSHLSLTQLLDIIFYWAFDLRQTYVAEDVGVTRKTLIDWQNFIRDICAQYLIDHPLQLGGPNKTVEIDESKFMHRKYHRGRYREGHWILGIIERESDNCILIPVEDRSAATLLPLIQRHVLPGTTIITDQWAAYNGLPNHLSVNHTLHFVDPNNPTIHTNKIEGNWAHCKAKYRAMHGTSHNLFETYLQEYMFKKQHKDNLFGNILYWISFYYST